MRPPARGRPGRHVLLLQWARENPLAVAGALLLAFFAIVAILAPYVIPYSPDATLRGADGRLLRLAPPTAANPFGTTNMGRDVFSQVVLGSRAAMLVGLVSGLVVTTIGTVVGLVAGYFRGWVDDVLMRLVDVLYGLPLIPLVIVIAALLPPSIWNVILAISLIQWTTVARTIRSQVLSLAERPFVKAARIAGCSDMRIMFVHIAPNVLPLTFLEMAFVAGAAITAEASLSFIGFGDPRIISWGQILHLAFVNGAVRQAWWWVLPPGLAIAMLVTALFFIARGLEVALNPRLRS